ncbi:MAG: hypothetical protein ACRDQ7_06065 [Haloechinothrix sp.]
MYCTAVMDAYGRRVVGWSITEHMRTELVTDALGMTILRREPGSGGIVHSDGSQGGFERRRNTSTRTCWVGRPPGWVGQMTGRAPMPSPGRRVSSREQRRQFWILIAQGLSSEHRRSRWACHLRPVRRPHLGHHLLPQLQRIPANPISHEPKSPSLGSFRTRREASIRRRRATRR